MIKAGEECGKRGECGEERRRIAVRNAHLWGWGEKVHLTCPHSPPICECEVESEVSMHVCM